MWMKLPPTKAGACCLPRPSLSFAYGVSCRARAERDALRPFRPIRPWNLQRFLRFLRSHPPVQLGLGTYWRGSIASLDDENRAAIVVERWQIDARRCGLRLRHVRETLLSRPVPYDPPPVKTY